jgi:hypothetical protein
VGREKKEHPHLGATYEIVERGASFAVEVKVPGTLPAVMSGFDTRRDAEGWVERHKAEVARACPSGCASTPTPRADPRHRADCVRRHSKVGSAAFGTIPGGESSRSPVATIVSRSSGNGRCSFSASVGSSVSQASHSSGVVRIAGIAFAWTGFTSSFGAVIMKP